MYVPDIKSMDIGTGVTTINNYINSDVKSAFGSNNHSNLESITIPETVTTIYSYFLFYCDSIKKITLPKSLTTVYGPIFSACPNLEFIGYRGTRNQ